ncbi:MAG: MOSC domain-containing protein [Mycobacteriales bacterium]
MTEPPTGTAGRLVSVNIGRVRPNAGADAGISGIDKRPVTGPVAVRAPGPKGVGGGSGLAGDPIVDLHHHGGDHQAAYAYASEDLAGWSELLGRPLPPGSFGENLTTADLDVTGALLGERWRIGAVLLRVTSARIPCSTFAAWLGEQRWQRRFTERGAPGAYLQVLEPGSLQAGDPVTVEHRPAHDVTIGVVFRAVTTDSALLPRVLTAGDDLVPELRAKVLGRTRRTRLP